MPVSGPEHAGLLESDSDDGLAARFDDAASHELPLVTVGAVAHAGLVALEEGHILSG